MKKPSEQFQRSDTAGDKSGVQCGASRRLAAQQTYAERLMSLKLHPSYKRQQLEAPRVTDSNHIIGIICGCGGHLSIKLYSL